MQAADDVRKQRHCRGYSRWNRRKCEYAANCKLCVTKWEKNYRTFNRTDMFLFLYKTEHFIVKKQTKSELSL